MELAQDESDLLARTKELTQRERSLSLEVLQRLREVEVRKLYLKIGYPSLYEYVVKELKYSEGAAYRRIQAMRLMKELPEMEEKVAKGSLSLTTAAQIQSFFRSKQAPKSEILSMLNAVEGKSTREVQKALVAKYPEYSLLERVRFLSSNKVELTLVIEEELRQRLEHLKSVRAHKSASMSYQQLLQELAKLGIKEWDPSSWTFRAQRTATSAPKSHRINDRIRSIVWKRDQASCAYVDPNTKRRCGSRHLLQIDHIKPLALGGDSNLSNLRLLCAGHNQWRAELTFKTSTSPEVHRSQKAPQ